jgi:uroporphyrinogen-III decarboxylase
VRVKDLKSRERFLRAVHFEEVDRVPHAVQFWPETVDKWYCEGHLKSNFRVKDYRPYGALPTGALDYDALCDVYELDMRPPWNSNSPFYRLDFSPMFPQKVMEEGETWLIVRDEWGIKKKVKRAEESVPQFLEFPVKTREDFESIKTRFDPEDPKRFPEDWEQKVRRALEEETATIGWGFPGFFGFARWLMGTQRLLIALISETNLIRKMFDFWADFVLSLAKAALEIQVDYLGIWEDLAYRNGPMISPQIFGDLFVPYYKKVTSAFRRKGVDVAIVDSDGDINSLIPLWLEGGVNGFLPLEVQAGMDVVSLREKYGDKIVLMGNVSLWALRRGPRAIDEEISRKFPSLLPGGGYIASTDHHIPPDVPYENFMHYLRRVQKWGRYSTR